MVIRIDTDSFNVDKTKHSGIFRITATVTTDDVATEVPELHKVSVMWNKNSGLPELNKLLEAEIPVPDQSFESAIAQFKVAHTETLVSKPVAPEPSDDMRVAGNLIIEGKVITE